ncbi:F-box protein [Raphanus sativus]|uniref:F-box protein At3g08750 n=1 Tax=Raphanus sativus TaxID=3726 RepID=A0A6J0LYX8_RAPSA|nr:F-box protein At3g08750 [Raphanus sativus]KAJ4885897.1 F-box protein [Raphanus sativus]
MASSKRSWSLSTLPPELIEEILYRTPAKSLVRAKPTCKKWYALITNKRFIYNHLDRSPKRFMRTVDTIQILDPVTRTLSETPIPNAFQPPYKIDTMVHCDGLMLCMCGRWGSREEERYVHLAIWNPVLRQIRWIKPSKCFTTSDYYGIGYDSKKKSRDGGYKILRFSDRRDDHWYFDYCGEPQVEVYECKTRSWRTLDAKVDWHVDIACKGVAAMGNMYWLAQKEGRFILGFDFSVERFKNVCYCPRSAYDHYLACFEGDRLSLLQQDEESRVIVVWVTNKLTDVDVSFTKYFSVSRPDVPALPFCTEMAPLVYFIGKQKRITAWCERTEGERDTFRVLFTLYEIDESGLIEGSETGRDTETCSFRSFLCGYVYVPSLVPLP